jgi:starch-binding outer membrane protein, SusD/RagB family
MKAKFKNKIVIALVALLFFSCSTDVFLEQRYEPQNPWQTIDQLEMAVAQPYSAFVQAGYSCPVSVNAFIEYFSTDFAKLIPDQTGNFPWNETYNRLMRTSTLEASSMRWIFSSFQMSYSTILGCNNPLAYLESGKTGKELFPSESQAKIDSELPRVRAELRFWRAFSYFNLARIFCPPYDPTGTNSDQILPYKITAGNPKNTKIGTTQEILDLVVSDLVTAKSLMPKTWSKEGRINYYTICGTLARVYFYMGNFSAAKMECDEIINSNRYRLQPDVMAAWNSAKGSPSASEVIWFYLPNDKGQNILSYTAFSRADAFIGKNGSRGADYAQCSWVIATMSNSVIKKFGWMVDPEKGDYTATPLALADKRYGNTWFRQEGYKPQSQTGITDATVYKNTYQSIIKTLTYPHIWLDKYYRGANGSLTRIPLMRSAEFYLMRAIINFRNGDKAGAAADLKVVRDRAGLPEISSAAIVEADIDREWMIELGGEGQYLPYLIALRKPIPRGDRDATVADVLPPYKGWYWKLPLSELQLNEGYNGLNPNDN